MKRSLIAALSMATVGSFASLASHAQSSDSSSLQMPYQKDFWTTGHVGLEFGRAKFHADCPAGASCDDLANAGKVFAGGRFNNIVGGEVSYVRTATFDRSSGNVKMQAVNLGLLAGIPLPNNSSIFGKLGAFWGHTDAGSDSQNGWGPSAGLGAMIGLSHNWALRLDWDRYRFKMPGGGGVRENLDTVMLGAQYTFGGPPR